MREGTPIMFDGWGEGKCTTPGHYVADLTDGRVLIMPGQGDQCRRELIIVDRVRRDRRKHQTAANRRKLMKEAGF